MSNYFYFFLIFIMCSNFSIAQRKDKIIVTGTIQEKGTNTPLEYATIVLKNTDNPSNISGGITNSKGEYTVEINTGNYDLSFEYIGFNTKTINNKLFSKNEQLKVIKLEINAETLEEVEIIAEKTTVEIRLDKKIYNVGKDLTIRGASVSDVLDNVPSVSVDVEGNVALRGNENVTILVNGKPTGLTGLSSTEALRQLPAESVQKVEVITSPSARYQSEGTAGILNIILKRSKTKGLNGAITTNIGYNPTAGISGNINYKTGEINLFNTTSYSYKEAPGNTSDYRENFNKKFDNQGQLIEDNPNTFSEETRHYDRKRNAFNTNIGIEWYINNTASLTTSVLYNTKDNFSNSTNNLNILDQNLNYITQTLRLYPELNKGETLQYAINFDKQFKTSGHKLTMDFQLDNTNENKQSNVNLDGLDSEKVATFTDQRRILLQSDYVVPVGKVTQFEIGFRGDFKDKTTDYTVQFLNLNSGLFEVDNNLTNLFNYKEYITAAYIQYGSKINKLSYLFGLRYEDTQITLDQPTTNDYSKNKYSGFFPTINLTYEINKSENITLAYNRRIRRPRSYFVNPFPSRSSVTSIFQGNPALAPSFTGTFDLGYLKRFGKFTFDSSIYYSKATDVFNFVNFDTGETVPVVDPVSGQTTQLAIINRTPINLATEKRFGSEFTLSYKPSKKWNINANLNIFKKEIEGVTPNGLNLDNTNTSWFARINNKYTLPGQIDWQTRIIYKGPNADAQNNRKGIITTNLAFSKDLLKEKASIAFNISDLFNSRKRIQTTTTPTYISKSEFQWRERSFNLSFTYRFNQKKKRTKPKQYGNSFEG